jgi:hypothetical protein
VLKVINPEHRRVDQGFWWRTSRAVIARCNSAEEIADWVLWLEDGAFQELATMATDRVCCMTVTSTTDPPPAGLCWRIYESYELVIC